MLPDDNSSDGRLPESELYERLRRNKLVSLPRDGEMLPSRLLDARDTSITAPRPLQVMPSHLQQSVPFRQDVVTPPSCDDSSAINSRRELFSFSLHEVAGEAMVSSSTRGRPKKGMASLLTLLLHENCGALCMFFFHEF